MPREDLAPKFLLFKKNDSCFLPFSKVLGTISKYKTNKYGRDAYELPSPTTPTEIQNFVKSRKPTTPDVTLIGVDLILNKELISKYLKNKNITLIE